MKKYNKSEIMKNAWTMVKSLKITISEALKLAWKGAKTKLNRKVKFENHMDITVELENGLTFTRQLDRWTKGNHDRIYINGGSRKGDGWVDIKTGFDNANNLAYTRKIVDIILNNMEF